jgi:macrophage erythroblast attacher
MYSEEKWETLRKQFQETFFGIYGITSLPLLSLVTSAGLSSLKLSACLLDAPHQTASQTSEPGPEDVVRSVAFSIPSLAASPPIHNMGQNAIDPSLPTMTDPTPIHAHPEHPQRNIDCPTCSKDMSVLAREVAFSHHVNSTIVCRISGGVMDDVNYPMAFPNGYVYSHKVSQN